MNVQQSNNSRFTVQEIGPRRKPIKRDLQLLRSIIYHVNGHISNITAITSTVSVIDTTEGTFATHPSITY